MMQSYQNSIPYRSNTGNATAQLVAAGSYNLNRASIHNLDDNEVWLHLYDAAQAGDVTVGTTTPVHSEVCPAGDLTNHSVREIHFHNVPIRFASGIVWAVTKERDGGATAPDQNALVNLSYS